MMNQKKVDEVFEQLEEKGEPTLIEQLLYLAEIVGGDTDAFKKKLAEGCPFIGDDCPDNCVFVINAQLQMDGAAGA